MTADRTTLIKGLCTRHIAAVWKCDRAACASTEFIRIEVRSFTWKGARRHHWHACAECGNLFIDPEAYLLTDRQKTLLEVRDILLEFCARQAWMIGPFKDADITLEHILSVMSERYAKLGIPLEVGLAEIPMVAAT